MPVARPRRRDDRVDYVIVRRTDVDGDGDIDDLDAFLESIHTPTQTAPPILNYSSVRKEEAKPTDTDDDDDDDGPPPIRVTVGLPQAQATGTAQANNDPTETVVVTIPPPPPKPHHRGGITRTTEHLLIAAGSIGATIIVVMILLAIHTMRKRGITFAEALRHGKHRISGRGPTPPPKKGGWDSTPSTTYVNTNDYGSTRNDTITPPETAMTRSASHSSQRPLMAPLRSDSFNRQPSVRSPTPETAARSFLLDSPLHRNPSNPSHRRANSETPSSPVLPPQNQRRNSLSTRNTRSISNGSELRYPDPPPERALSPLPPPPTFRQFLFNRKSVSARPGFGPMVSRFSWTNSNAPQTPHDPHRDTNSHTITRDSFMTQRSSMPRFRTVDSWVTQQASRLEEQKLREQLRYTQSSTVYSRDDHQDVPEVPMLPKNVSALREATPINSATQSSSPSPVPNRASGLPGKNVKHERHDTHTTVETAPIFRQHPGNEVRISTRSLVPSEILNGGLKNSVL
ncbi:hypothetical protein K469DRAFT_724264 [Zopfia rhizophila CBS 207.26]|uniref:Uncharacterized protein n=1 Tax=Zopfia rhizophila CBS 207.26 TaxID=1314779 RepID=A0A6A6EEA6_9PEZI|nr:hypothetical protein K469DRAFT_724264 [Zopfia rhizophila CBS 207.26]